MKLLKIAVLFLTMIVMTILPITQSSAQTEHDSLLFPPNRPHFILLRRSQVEAPVSGEDVFVPINSNTDELAQETEKLLSDPHRYPYVALRLHQFAKNYLANNSSSPSLVARALNEPTYLFLSDRRGGFPGQTLPVWGIGLMIRRWRGQADNIRQLSGNLASWLAVFAITGAMY